MAGLGSKGKGARIATLRSYNRLMDWTAVRPGALVPAPFAAELCAGASTQAC
jgi:hypothetical protein